MKPLEYLFLQLQLEGMQVINDNRLRQVNLVPGEDVPLMLLVQFAGGQVVSFYDELLETGLYLELEKQARQIQFPNLDPVLDVLTERNVLFETGQYKTNVFPNSITELAHPDVTCRSRDDSLVQAFGFGEFAERVYVVVRDGQVVSACVSARENDRCGEAWVCTAPRYRRQGFAHQVVGAWAQNMIGTGKVPFYSYKIQNIASANLAKHLGLVLLFEEISVQYLRG